MPLKGDAHGLRVMFLSHLRGCKTYVNIRPRYPYVPLAKLNQGGLQDTVVRSNYNPYSILGLMYMRLYQISYLLEVSP